MAHLISSYLVQNMMKRNSEFIYCKLMLKPALLLIYRSITETAVDDEGTPVTLSEPHEQGDVNVEATTTTT